jgi:hypothetical protein
VIRVVSRCSSVNPALQQQQRGFSFVPLQAARRAAS